MKSKDNNKKTNEMMDKPLCSAHCDSEAMEIILHLFKKFVQLYLKSSLKIQENVMRKAFSYLLMRHLNDTTNAF